tara:strand:+ start:220 stop:636 length:417 start_codon:yes stop_codon:yes gene_type:complete
MELELLWLFRMSEVEGSNFELVQAYNDMINAHCEEEIKNKILGSFNGRNLYYNTSLIWGDKLYLSDRVFNKLRTYNIKTVGELLEYNDVELLRFPSFGKESLKEVIKELYLFSLFIKRHSSDSLTKFYWELESEGYKL